MKTITRFALTTVAALTLVSTVSAAQNSATTSATATANIVSPIAISNSGPLNFGDVVATALLGTVVVGPGSGRTSTGGTFLGSSAGVSAAAFTVTGATGYAYTVSFPLSPISITGPGAATMSVDTFTSNPATSNGLLTGGTQALTVGGTLHVAANQPLGAYSGLFNVTVTYN